MSNSIEDNDELRAILGDEIWKYTDIPHKIETHYATKIKEAEIRARYDEVSRIDGYAYGTDYGQYQKTRLTELEAQLSQSGGEW